MNFNNSGMRTYHPTSRSDSAQRASAGLTGQVDGSATRAIPAGHGYLATASNIASGLPQSSVIQQRQVSATSPAVSAQPGNYDLGSRMAYFEPLLDSIVDFYSSIKDIADAAILAHGELANIEETGTPAMIISELKDWNKFLKFSFFDNPVFDSSQTITAEFAAHALKHFQSKINTLLSIPNLEITLDKSLLATAVMKPEIRANNKLYQDTKRASYVQEQITMARQLQQLMNNDLGVLSHVLPMTQFKDAYQSLKSDLDSCIRDILRLQENMKS